MSGFTSTAALSSADEPGEGRESLDSLASTCIASLFSWELRGSTASLLGTGVRVVGRLAKDRELDFVVVSFRQDGGDALLSFGVADRVALEVGVEALLLDWVADLEKKPNILCCFPVDANDKLLAFLAVEGVLAGVRAGVLDFSPIFVENESINRL